MKKYFIIITSTSVFNRQFITISKENLNFEIGEEDNVYISENGIIQTIWKLYKKSREKYRFEKINVIREGCKYEELNVSKLTTDKFIYIEDKKDIEYLNRVFEHKIKIYPQYNIKQILNKDIDLINSLKRYDPKIEFYYNAIIDNSQKVSVAIIPTYGVCVIENFEEDSLGNVDSNVDIVLEKLKQNKTLYNDKQLIEMKNSIILNDNNELNINYKKYMICNKLNKEQITLINTLLKAKANYIEFITTELLMEKLLNISEADKVIIDEQMEYGIKCALMPQYIINKSSTIFKISNEGKIKIPQSSIELDDEQIRILDELNEKTYIEATAGTGKSVLLLTKAYMMAKANPTKDFLLICFNSKLCEEIENEAKYKNQQTENLQIRTFDKFIQENFSNTNNWEENHKIFIEKVRNR